MVQIVRIAALAGLLLFLPTAIRAQLTLADVKVARVGPWSVVQVDFTFLLRYVRHDPQEMGDDLRIHVEPIGVVGEARENIFRRQTVTAPPGNSAALVEVVYEGDVDNGPYVTLVFQRPVAFRVQQGGDFRSVIVAVQPGAGISEGTGKVIRVVPESSQIVLSHEAENGVLREKTLVLTYDVDPPVVLKGLKPADPVEFTLDRSRRVIVAIEPVRKE